MEFKLQEKHKHPILSIAVDKVDSPVNAIIDTGCYENYFFIGNNKPEDYGIFKLTGKLGVAHAAGGAEIPHQIVVHKITIAKWDFELEFGLCPGSFMGCSVILGTRFLHDNKMVLSISGDHFSLNKITE
jgi:hypothetical protein